jgi:TBC1 domain family member 15
LKQWTLSYIDTLVNESSFTDLFLILETEKVDGLNLFFCFRFVTFNQAVYPLVTHLCRWILIAFKREFPFEQVLALWEVLWTDYYSDNFVLFVALAVLESHRDMILRYLVEFDEILKVCAFPAP